MPSEDMFENSEQSVQHGKGHEIKWRLVTNHQNLMFMLSAGLIMPPSGFGKKYYQDTLSLVPGWVPLFPDTLWKSAIDHSVAEQALLRPCYAELDLSSMLGEVKVLRSGRWLNAHFPDEVYGNEDLILVPAPLPVSMIKEIVFSSKEDKVFCEKDALNFSNVPLADFKTKSAATPFKKANNGAWPPPIDGVEERQIELTLPDAFGGVVTVLNRFANRCDTAIELYKAFFQNIPGEEVSTKFPMLLGAHTLFYVPELEDEQTRASSTLFGKIAGALLRARSQTGLGSPRDVVMAVLEEANANMQGQNKVKSERLIEDLKRVVQLPDKTLDELIETHQGPLSRALILFYLNDTALDLLEETSKQVSGYEMCAAATLFGIAEGWMRMTGSLRDTNGLSLVAPAYMAHLSHRLSGSKLVLGALPIPPRSLRALLSEKPSDKKVNDAALYIARACKWDCIKTRIRLGKGDYQLLIDGSGASLVLDGDIKAVEAEVDQEKFMVFLSGESGIPAKVENEARKMLEK